jgi:plasmid stabilization system protein ParE
MTSIEIFVRHDAELDALAYFQQIHQSNPEAALRFLQSLDETIEGLALQPLKGRPRRFRGKDLANMRSWRVERFETYLIFYRFAGSRLDILRIRHGAMKFPRALRRR